MTAVDLSILAGLLVDELQKRCADPSPVRDLSETVLVDQFFAQGYEFAETYVARRITHALGRVRAGLAPGDEAWKSGDVIEYALIVLGGYAHLRDLQAVKA